MKVFVGASVAPDRGANSIPQLTIAGFGRRIFDVAIVSVMTKFAKDVTLPYSINNTFINPAKVGKNEKARAFQLIAGSGVLLANFEGWR